MTNDVPSKARPRSDAIGYDRGFGLAGRRQTLRAKARFAARDSGSAEANQRDRIYESW